MHFIKGETALIGLCNLIIDGLILALIYYVIVWLTGSIGVPAMIILLVGIILVILFIIDVIQFLLGLRGRI